MSPAALSPLRTRPARLAASIGAVLVTGVLAVGCAVGGSGGGTAAPTTLASPAGGASTTVATTSTTAPTTTTTVATTTTTTAPLDPNKVTEVGPLRSGSLGLRTKAVQQALKDQHYDPGTVDGRFGLKTTMAVWAFQQLNGLAPDGVVGPATEAKVLARPAQAMLRPALGPTHTEVDLRRQVMVVWRGGAPVLITHVSTGSQVPYCTDTKVGRSCGDAVTHTGVFHFGRRVSGWREAALGRLYNPVYFDGGIAVHGAASVPNHPASHGCVRIPMSIAEYFPSLVNTGDTIEVFRS